MMRRMRPKLTTFATGVILLSALFACKKSKPMGSDPSPASSGTTTTATPSTPDEPSSEFMSDTELSRVCNELGVKGAAAYDGAIGKIHPTVVFTRKDENAKYEKSYDNDFDGWKTDKAKDYELVACVTIKKSSKVKECKFDSNTPIHYLDLEDASFDFAVYEAKTGKQLGTKSADLKVDKECPMIWMFHDERESKTPDFEQALMGWAKQYVAPKAGQAAQEEKAEPAQAAGSSAKSEAQKSKPEPAKPAAAKSAAPAAKTPAPAKGTPAKSGK